MNVMFCQLFSLFLSIGCQLNWLDIVYSYNYLAYNNKINVFCYKMKKEVFLFMFLFIFSCQNMKEKEFTPIDLANAFAIDSPEVIYSFPDKYPTDISIRDTIAFIIQIKSDTCLMALNLNTQQIIQSFGISGHGPNDIIFPLFISSINDIAVLLQDGFAKKLNIIDINERTKQFAVKKYMDCPNQIYPSGETNISENFIVGRKVGRNERMFYVYNRSTDNVTEIDFYPKLKQLNPNRLNPDIDLNYLYASSIALNEERNRILSGMYFFDMFHVYDLSGNRIKTCYFSQNYIPSFSSNASMEDIIQKCNMGLIRSFPTKNYCYFLRAKRDSVDNMLIQVDWDGNFINAYHITDDIQGQFYIDEKDNTLYSIRHRIMSDGIEEVFEVVSYSLQ